MATFSGIPSPRVDDLFTPAPGLLQWIRSTILEPSHTLFNRDHQHLEGADIGILWAGIDNVKRGKRIIGQAQLGQPAGSDAWKKARQTMQLKHFFDGTPDFVITLDAGYFEEATMAERLALIEHELYHCALATDVFGSPRFRRDGSPIWTMRPHDVEEFVSVVRRYGAEAAHVHALVEVAVRGPTIAPARITALCGTCQK